MSNFCGTDVETFIRYTGLADRSNQVFHNIDAEKMERCHKATEVLKKSFDSLKNAAVFFNETKNETKNQHGMAFVMTDYGYSSFRIDNPEKQKEALKFLEVVDAIAIVSEKDPDTKETVLTLDWRVDGVRF